MSRFYGNMKGSRGETTRCGDRISGITGHLRGWDIGARVTAFVGPNGEDLVEVWITGGSNGSCASVFLGRFVRDGAGIGRQYCGESIPYVYKAGEE